MNKGVFHKILKIELLIIIILLLAILVVSVLNDRWRRNAKRPAPAAWQSELRPPGPDILSEDAQYTAMGLASFYGNELHGNTTAGGDVYDKNALTAAHRELPFDTQVRVTNMENGRQVVVRINDRGPDDETRILDVSEKAAKKLGIFESGVAQVRLEVLE